MHMQERCTLGCLVVVTGVRIVANKVTVPCVSLPPRPPPPAAAPLLRVAEKREGKGGRKREREDKKPLTFGWKGKHPFSKLCRTRLGSDAGTVGAPLQDEDKDPVETIA